MKLLLMVLAATMLAVPVWAADVPLSWNAVEGADGYKLYMSEDGRQTWKPALGVDVGLVTRYVWRGVPETGIVYFRASSYKMTETVRLNAGAWFDGTQPVCSNCPSPGVE